MITTTDFFLILKRSKWLGAGVFGVAMLVGAIVVIVMPLRYEAVIGIEKRQAQISLQPIFSEYDVTRFTSENERTIAVLRSRYMLVEWLKAIGLPWKTPRQLERQLKKLDKRFVIRPVNFTDLYLLKVQAGLPAEAGRRAELIVQLFQKWDETQAQNESKEVIMLLKKRLEVVRMELSRKRELIRESKLSRTINLSGSTSESQLETDIRANQNLYDGLAEELEKAERGTDPLSAQRVRIAIPLSISEKPIHSRLEYIVITFCLSILLMFASVFLNEWQKLVQKPMDETTVWIDKLTVTPRT